MAETASATTARDVVPGVKRDAAGEGPLPGETDGTARLCRPGVPGGRAGQGLPLARLAATAARRLRSLVGLFHPPTPGLARDFGCDQAVLMAYNQRLLGIREVPVAAITGTVGRTDLFRPAGRAALTRTSRYAAIHRALASGKSLPPVDLCLLAGHHYIRDGHHRVIAARRLGILAVEAEITEFLPTPHSPAAAWHRARASFERDTGLTGPHVRDARGYEWLRRQIAEHGWYLGERCQAPCSFAAAAARWEREVYRPALANLAAAGALDLFPDLTPAELYLAVCEHKWYRSERLRRDVGFATAVVDFAGRSPCRWVAQVGRWLARASAGSG